MLVSFSTSRYQLRQVYAAPTTWLTRTSAIATATVP